LNGELRPHLVQGRADHLERLHEVGVEHRLVIVRHTRADDCLDRPLPRHRAGRITGPQHGRDGGPHAGGQRRLHARRGRLAEYVRDVAGPAGGALDVLADLVQRDDREEEDGEPPAPSPVSVFPVPAAPAAVAHALPPRPVEHAQAEDDQHRWPPFAGTAKPIMSPPALAPPLPIQIRYLIFRPGRGRPPADTAAHGAAGTDGTGYYTSSGVITPRHDGRRVPGTR